MKTLTFWKMNGAGNDFVCVDNRRRALRFSSKQITRLCQRQTGVGADGLLLLETTPKGKGDFRMRYYNADGSEASMCGNGARCFAKFARQQTGWKKTSMKLLTRAGLIEAEFVGENVRIQLTSPSSPFLNQPIRLTRGVAIVHFIDTGVPHAVVFVDDVEHFPVEEVGRELRYHQNFKPQGTNANFAQVLRPRVLRLRTYERGVEGETLACGTGVTAASLIAHLVHGFSSPIKVTTQGGDTLVVHFKKSGDQFQDVTLLGPAEVTFKGEYNV
ncbi:MAG: diaminopimelate epimerase [bacterium]